MTVLLVIVAIAGWSVAAFALVRWTRRTRELRVARSSLGASAELPLEVAVEQAKQDAEDRVGAAEAAQHWLVGALDQAPDGIIVVDRIGREVLRNAAAHDFQGARHGEVIAEDALDRAAAAGADRSRRRT